MQRLAGKRQRYCVKLGQERTEIDEFLALVGCSRLPRFQFLKLLDPIAKSFDDALGSDSDIDGHRRLTQFRRIIPAGLAASKFWFWFWHICQRSIRSASLKWVIFNQHG